MPWIEQAQPDVLALQELKCTEQAYPSVLAELGYQSVVQATGRWNGVALASRVGLDEPALGLPGQPEFEGAVEPRAVGATCGGVRVWSVYVPNGREPTHDHFAYKLAWLDCLAQTCASELAADPTRPFAVIGDFNIAPTDADVWDISLFTESTHVTPAERTRLQALVDLGLQDLHPRSLKGEPFTGAGACESTSSWPTPPSSSRLPIASSTAKRVKAKAPPITHPSWSTCGPVLRDG